ncbi:hypothetical protein GJS41_10395 [Kangiella sp. HZ709]|nr:hypothetical protein [Kangiella sp. HZ709]
MTGLSVKSDKNKKFIPLKGKSLFGDLKARQIGPALMSGRIIDLENHPTNDRVFYAGTAGGGVWRTSNGGATFQPIFDDHPQSIGAVALDPTKPDKNIWVGTGEIWTRNSVSVGDGLYKSTDGGVNWEKVGFQNSERISSIEINPNNPNEIYVGVLGALWGDSDERGVYKSTDGGKSWDKILYVSATTGASDLIMDPNNPNILYASMWEFRRTGWSFSSGGLESALYKSVDAGKSWEKIHKGFPDGKLGRIALAVAPSDSKRLYAVLETEKDSDKGLYRSDDAGASWKHLNNDFELVVRPFYFSRIVVDPRNPDVVAKGGLSGSISRDGGKTFRNLGSMHADIHDFVFDINNSDRMFVATDGGVYRTWDGGTTMEIVENIPVSQFYHVSVDNKEPYNVYGGLQDNGSWYGPSSSPGGIEARDWNSVGFGDGFRVLKHPTKDIVYSEMQGAENIWRYDIKQNQTKTIQPLAEEGDPKLRFNWNTPIETSHHKPDRLFVGSQFVHVSDDMGDTWKKISPDLTTNDPAKQNQEDSGGLSADNSGAENHTTIFTIAESPLDRKILWVGTDDGNVQVSKNGGKTWSNVVKNIPGLPANTWVAHIEASVHGKGTAYAVFDGHTNNDTSAYVYKTTDYGKTWSNIGSNDLYGFARNIQEDYVNSDLLFLGTEFGLYVTVDSGQSWSLFDNNMPRTAVHYIELQKQTNDIVMGTHGRGVIIIDDISPLREVTAENLEKDVHFFATKPATIIEESGFGGGSKETQFVGPNPNRQAQLKYLLKKRHIFGKMKIELYDKSGDKIADLPAGKSKGINIVSWNGRMKPPKVAKGKTFTFGAFTGPQVPAGTYKVVMTKGKKTYESEIELVNDKSSLLKSKERKSLQKTTMDLYDMSQDLAYQVYQIDEYLAKANELSKINGDVKAQAQPVIEKLNQLKDTLVITKGDNYVGSVEPQLREKISKLYGKVSGSFVAPSKAEINNLQLLKKELSEATKKLNGMKGNELSKLLSLASSNNIKGLRIKSFDEFIDS